ncbi:hypothetical protein AQ477_04470 [Burkholderia thailandensis]|nr:hypothetical protein AQ477_04470 [Burkholderia thailandensis]KXF60151.1 hypothetical protein AQ476_01865 [Burkholderia thailandensis]PNE75795.1 hypothetical protein A8H37_30040 [Burkholderia thailandensis]
MRSPGEDAACAGDARAARFARRRKPYGLHGARSSGVPPMLNGRCTAAVPVRPRWAARRA